MRPKRVRKILHRRGHFPPPLRRLPLVVRRHLVACRYVSTRNRMGPSGVIWEPGPSRQKRR